MDKVCNQQIIENTKGFVRENLEGEVVQVIEGDPVLLRVSTRKDEYEMWFDDIIYVYYPKKLVKSRVLQDDIINVYGMSEGLMNYQSTLGGKITIPKIRGVKIEDNYQNY